MTMVLDRKSERESTISLADNHQVRKRLHCNRKYTFPDMFISSRVYISVHIFVQNNTFLNTLYSTYTVCLNYETYSYFFLSQGNESSSRVCMYEV